MFKNTPAASVENRIDPATRAVCDFGFEVVTPRAHPAERSSGEQAWNGLQMLRGQSVGGRPRGQPRAWKPPREQEGGSASAQAVRGAQLWVDWDVPWNLLEMPDAVPALWPGAHRRLGFVRSICPGPVSPWPVEWLLKIVNLISFFSYCSAFFS